MILRKSSIRPKAGNTVSPRRYVSALVGSLALAALFACTTANAQPVHFRNNGRPWSHHWHSGWHRYWGGPTIGFYYAPSPVFIVSGYSDPYYYTGPDFWYSDPSFGLSINLGGGRYYGGGHYYHHRDYDRWHGGGHWNGGGHWQGGGGHFDHGDHFGGGHGRDRR